VSSKHYLIDMDGVLVSGKNMIPGADEFLSRCRERGTEFLVLTNNPMYTPGDLAHRLALMGLEIPPERILAHLYVGHGHGALPALAAAQRYGLCHRWERAYGGDPRGGL